MPSTSVLPSWDDRVAAFWATADRARPSEALRDMAILLTDAADQRAAGLFEWASVHDFLGFTDDATRHYEMALNGALDERRRMQAISRLGNTRCSAS